MGQTPNMSQSPDDTEERNQAGHRAQPAAADPAGGDRRQHAAVRRGPWARFDRRARAGARARAVVRRRRSATKQTGTRVLRSVDAIADFIDQPRAWGACMTAVPRPWPAANVFTVDVEEWFHICGVGGPLAPEHWERLPSRVVQTTRLAARRAGSRRRPRHVLRARLGGRAASRSWSPRSRAAGHEIGSHGHESSARLRARRRRASVADVRQSVAALRNAGVAQGDRVPRAGVVDQRSLPVGARTAGAGGIHARRQHGAGAPGRQSPTFRASRTSGPRPSGPILEVPPLVADRFGQVMPLGWGWGLRMSSPASRARGDRAAQRGRRPGRADGPSVGDRSRPAARAAAAAARASRTTSGSTDFASGCEPS